MINIQSIKSKAIQLFREQRLINCSDEEAWTAMLLEQSANYFWLKCQVDISNESKLCGNKFIGFDGNEYYVYHRLLVDLIKLYESRLH